MKLDPTLLRAILAVGGLLTCGAGLANAEDAEDVGIVRISDHAPGTPCNSGCQPGGCPSGQCNTGCPNGYCGNGYCGNGCGNRCGYGRCYHRCHCTGHLCRVLSWLDPLGGCTLPPDAGWSPPGKVPMWRRGVAYNKFFPDCWTGQPAMPVVAGMPRAQQVYMPTDTTQLGFYYQQVPHWQPVGGMIPGPANPDEMHQGLFGDASMGGPVCQTGNCPNAAPVAAPSADQPAVDAPPAPMADLSAGGLPSLRPTPR